MLAARATSAQAERVFSMGAIGRIVQEAKRLGGETSRGRNVQGAKLPGGESSRGRTDEGATRPVTFSIAGLVLQANRSNLHGF